MAVVIDGTNNDITGLVEPLAVGAAVGASDAITKSAAEGQMLGVGQTWQNVTASRASATTYTNSTGKPIFVSICAYNASSTIELTVSGMIVSRHTEGTANAAVNVSAIVPDGATYSLNASTIQSWAELR